MTAGRKPPHNVQVLQRWVGELARDDGIAPARLQRWISFMVVAGLLEHARDEQLDPLFVLKGGAAMELRLGLRARATSDVEHIHAAGPRAVSLGDLEDLFLDAPESLARGSSEALPRVVR